MLGLQLIHVSERGHWFLMSPAHQHPWYWLCVKCSCLQWPACSVYCKTMITILYICLFKTIQQVKCWLFFFQLNYINESSERKNSMFKPWLVCSPIVFCFVLYSDKKAYLSGQQLDIRHKMWPHSNRRSSHMYSPCLIFQGNIRYRNCIMIFLEISFTFLYIPDFICNSFPKYSGMSLINLPVLSDHILMQCIKSMTTHPNQK